MTERSVKLRENTMTHTSHKTAKSNYFFTALLGTNLVKGNAGDTCRQCLVWIRSFVMKPFTDHFSFARKTISLCLIAAFVLTNVLAVHIFGSEFHGNDSAASASYTTDLTQLGREGRLRQSPNFETEVNKVLEVLAKGGSRQPVVVDENGSVQDEIVEQIAIRFAKGSVPASLQNHSLVKLETSALYSNSLDTAARTAAFEKILGTVLGSKGQTILFVEDLPTFVRSDAFVAAVRDGKITLIGGSSIAAFNEKIASNDELANLFEMITVDTPKTSKEAVDSREKQFVGDNVSPDLREMMKQDPSGTRRVNVILQARDADNAALRALLNEGSANIIRRIGTSESMVVNMSLAALQTLSTSGLINYVSPDRSTGA